MGMSDEVLATDPASGYDPGSWLLFNNVFQSLLSFPKGGTDPAAGGRREVRLQGQRQPRSTRCTLQGRPEVQQR